MIESEQIVKTVRYLGKIRKTIILILMMLLTATCIVYYKSDILVGIVTAPLNGLQLYFLTPVEGIMTRIEISLLCGFVIAFPFILAIVIFKARKRLSLKKQLLLLLFVVPFSTIVFIGGIVFAYKLILPSTINFLLTCAQGLMLPLLSAKSYISFVMFFLITVGLVFELPLVLVSLSRLGFITSKGLMGKRKMAILLTVVLMAILTPTPDAFTLLAVSLPMILLFEVSIWWIFILEKLDRRKEVLVDG